MWGCSDRDTSQACAQQGGLCRPKSAIGPIVVFGQVCEHQVFEAAARTVLDEPGRLGIREMTVGTTHALLECPGVRSLEQHLKVVVELDECECAPTQLALDQTRRAAEIRDDSNIGVADANDIRDGVARVVRNGERLNLEVPDLEALTGTDEL